MDNKDIGERIRNQRKKSGMSQQELAEAVGYTSKVAISRIEAGQINVPMDKMVKIANALQVPVSELMRLSDPAPYDKSYGRNVRTIRFEHDIVYEAFRGLDEDEIKRVLEYARMIKESKLWQQQRGTEKDGVSELQKMGIPDPSLLVRPAEKDVKK